MSMQGGIGAAHAARELLELIQKQIQLNRENKQTVETLRVIAERAQSIIEAGESGWY